MDVKIECGYIRMDKMRKAENKKNKKLKIGPIMGKLKERIII